MIRPTVLPSVLLTSIWTFNNFNLVYLVTGGNDKYDILVTRIYDFVQVPPEIATQYGWTYGYAAAYSSLIFIILLVYIYIFARASNLTEKTF
jgi:arabinogalactan oligomer/maltooligosaccharide transport system permease protein